MIGQVPGWNHSNLSFALNKGPQNKKCSTCNINNSLTELHLPLNRKQKSIPSLTFHQPSTTFLRKHNRNHRTFSDLFFKTIHHQARNPPSFPPWCNCRVCKPLQPLKRKQRKRGGSLSSKESKAFPPLNKGWLPTREMPIKS